MLLILATATELPPAFWDAHQASALPAQPLISDTVAVFLGFLAVSSLATAYNAWLRRMKAQGKRASPVLLFLGSFLNLFAANFDQAVRQGRAGAGKAGPKEPQP